MKKPSHISLSSSLFAGLSRGLSSLKGMTYPITQLSILTECHQTQANHIVHEIDFPFCFCVLVSLTGKLSEGPSFHVITTPQTSVSSVSLGRGSIPSPWSSRASYSTSIPLTQGQTNAFGAPGHILPNPPNIFGRGNS